MTSGLEDHFAQNPIFTLFTQEQQAVAAQRARCRTFEKGTYITFYGDVWPYLFIVNKGIVDALKESSEGRQLIVLTLEPGGTFWGLGFFSDGAKTPVTLKSRENSELYLWSRDDLLPLLFDRPDALWRLCQQMTILMQQASQIVEGLAFQPVAGRLARLLLDQFADVGETSMARDLTLDQIAARIGTTREQACRALYQFSDRNLIRITRTEFELTDEGGLTEIAGKS